MWGAILAISLQARAIELTHDDVRAFSALAAYGAAVATIAQLLAGAWSDRHRASRAAMYVAGAALAVPAIVWLYAASTFAQLCAAFACVQIAMNLAIAAYQAAIPDFVAPARRGIASAWMSAYQSLGNAAGVIVAGLVADVRLIASMLAAGLAATCWITTAHARRLVLLPPASRGAVRQRAPLGVLIVSRGLIYTGFFTLLDYLAFFVHDSLNVSLVSQMRAQTGYLFLTFTLAAVPGAAFAGRPADRYDKRAVVTVACGVLIGALLLLAPAAALPQALLAAALAGAAWGGFVAADWALAAALLPGGAMATAMAIWNAGITLPQILTPLIAFPVIARFNARAYGLGPRAAIVAASIEIALGTIAIWKLPRA